MQRLSRILIIAGIFASFSPFSSAATITGIVKGPDGAPFEGGFVEAQNSRTHMTFIALSNSQGRYSVERIPAGPY
jgi:uncharacterized protein involved in tellurium resistance